MSVYEKSYGAVQFYDLDGNLLFDSVNTYGLWTSADDEPSPEVKWTRVSVPGADGAVDLSRALAGQVTYEQREIELQFSGKQTDHAAAVAFLRTMRAMLHGARVRISTVLTGLAGGYYVADTECDGTVYPDGTVVIDVKAWADPFIHVGTQALALPASTKTTSAAAVTQTPDSDLVAGAGRITAAMAYSSSYATTPKDATSGRLWYARGDDPDATNVLDVTRLNVVGYDGGSDGSSYSYTSSIYASGHDIVLGTLDGDFRHVYLSASRRSGTINDSRTVGVPYIGGDNVNSSQYYVGVYLTGTIDSVGSAPSIDVSYMTNVIDADSHGGPSGGTSQGTTSVSVTSLAAGSYDDTLVMYCSRSVSRTVYAIDVTLSDITSDDLTMRLVATRTAAGVPTHWKKPRLGYVTVDFGGSFCHTATATDTAVISPIGVTTTHNCEPLSSGYTAVNVATSYTTTGGLDGWLPDNAQLMCLSVTNSYGENCPVVNIATDSYGVQTASGTNGTMRSTPTVTSEGGAYVAVNGESMVVDAGTQELSTLTLGEGSFTVTYATLSEDAATLTWEGGVL